MDDTLLSSVCSPLRRSFEDALPLLRKYFLKSQHPVEDVISVLEAISDSDLPEREAFSRCQQVYEAAPLAPSARKKLATSLVHASPAVRHALVAMLPDELKLAATGGTPPQLSRDDSPHTDEFSANEPIDKQPLVLLIGSMGENQASNSLLKGVIDTVRVPDVASALTLSAEAVCGVIVESDVWAQSDDHIAGLHDILSLSSLGPTHIDTRGLHPEAKKALLLLMDRQERLYAFPRKIVAIESKDIAADFLSLVTRALRVVQAATQATLHPAQLTASEALLLRRVAIDLTERRHVEGEVHVERIDTRVFEGGQSGAKTVLVTPRGGHSVVVKFASLKELSEEAENFARFIVPACDGAQPSLHIGYGCSALAFKIVSEVDLPEVPASPLSGQFELLSLWEMGWDTGPDSEALSACIQRAISWLEKVNRQPASSGDSVPEWMITALKSAVDRGLRFDLTESGDDVEGSDGPVVDLAMRSFAAIKSHCGVAAGHGDVHLGNILVVDGRVPCFIDFRWAGASHPLMDLLRLESAVVYRYFRPTVSEHRIAEAFVSMLEGLSYNELLRRHPFVGASKSNTLCIELSCSVRDACFKLLEHHRLPASQYRALRALLAAHCLLKSDLQCAVVRASVNAHMLLA